MKAVFRVDASSTIGSGHLSRCLTLARAFATRGVDVAFATREPTDHTRGWIGREGHQLVEVAGASEADAARKAVGAAELVVVDGYTFGADIHEALRAPGRIVCVVDDTGSGSSPIRADAVLNGNLFGESVAYPNAGTKLDGPSYALVRDEFREARERIATRAAEDRRRVLVTMGGADPAGATETFLVALEASAIESCELTVVVGGSNPRVAAIREAAARIARHRVDLRVDVARMSELMIDTDVAVVAAGSTCLELACIGVPAVVVSVADNQDPVAAEVARRGLMESVGRFGASSGPDLVARMDALLRDRVARSEAIQRQRANVDGLGAGRAADALLACVAARLA